MGLLIFVSYTANIAYFIELKKFPVKKFVRKHKKKPNGLHTASVSRYFYLTDYLINLVRKNAIQEPVGALNAKFRLYLYFNKLYKAISNNDMSNDDIQLQRYMIFIII